MAARKACLDPKNTSNVCGCRVVVFDKNVPERNGWNKFLKIFTPTFKDFDEVYSVQFCPKELGKKEVNVIQRRMAKRVQKKGKIVLSMQTPDYDKIMFGSFLPSCRGALSEFHASRGTMVTDQLFTDGAADTVIGDFIQHMEGGLKNWLPLTEVVQATSGPKTKYWGVQINPTALFKAVDVKNLCAMAGFDPDTEMKQEFHVTLAYNPQQRDEDLFWFSKQNLGVNFILTYAAWDDKCLAATVVMQFDFPQGANTQNLHVTLALKEGVQGVHSNSMLATPDQVFVPLNAPCEGFINRYLW
jgi:hypothetical protein